MLDLDAHVDHAVKTHNIVSTIVDETIPKDFEINFSIDETGKLNFISDEYRSLCVDVMKHPLFSDIMEPYKAEDKSDGLFSKNNNIGFKQIGYSYAGTIVLNGNDLRRTGGSKVRHLDSVARNLYSVGHSPQTVAVGVRHDDTEDIGKVLIKKIGMLSDYSLDKLSFDICSTFSQEMSASIPGMSHNQVEEIRDLQNLVSKLNDNHYIDYLVGINTLPGIGLKLEDQFNNSVDLWDIPGLPIPNNNSGKLVHKEIRDEIQKLKTLYKATFAVHFLRENLVNLWNQQSGFFSMFKSQNIFDSVAKSYVRLTDALSYQFDSLINHYDKKIGYQTTLKNTNQFNNLLKGPPERFRKVTAVPLDNRFGFDCTIMRYHHQAMSKKRPNRTFKDKFYIIDTSWDPSRIYSQLQRDCIVGKNIIERLYSIAKEEGTRPIDEITKVNPLAGMTAANLHDSSLLYQVAVSGIVPIMHPN